jgi:hypothetical protein
MDNAATDDLERRACAARREAAEAHWSDHMVVEPEQLKSLMEHLDERLVDDPCDHTLRLTSRWTADNGVDIESLEESLAHFGGGCDCEVLANVDPLTQVDGWPAYVDRFGPG